MSWAQNALLELKLAAIRCLCHQDFLVLLGETEDTQQRWCVSVSIDSIRPIIYGVSECMCVCVCVLT